MLHSIYNNKNLKNNSIKYPSFNMPKKPRLQWRYKRKKQNYKQKNLFDCIFSLIIGPSIFWKNIRLFQICSYPLLGINDKRIILIQISSPKRKSTIRYNICRTLTHQIHIPKTILPLIPINKINFIKSKVLLNPINIIWKNKKYRFRNLFFHFSYRL